MIRSAAEWIEALQLLRHPEGGWYRETYRSAESMPGNALPPRFGGDRSFATAIYFLLEGGDFSALHRIKSDELWHFHAGTPLVITSIAPDGNLARATLGLDPANGAFPQVTVPTGSWFGAHSADPDGYALVSCTVAPGFDFADFEMPRRDELLSLYPRHAAVITALTRR
jgi:hypothetical protein